MAASKQIATRSNPVTSIMLDRIIDKPALAARGNVPIQMLNSMIADLVANAVVIEEINTASVGGGLLGAGWGLLCDAVGPEAAFKVLMTIVYQRAT